MTLSIKDFSEEGKVDSDLINDLVDLCVTASMADDYILAMEDKLKEAKDRRKNLLEVLIPEHLDKMGMEEFKLTSGKKVTIKSIIAASIPAEQKDEAFGWLEDNDHGDIIKTQLKIMFNREDHSAAKELAENLMKDNYNVSESSTVHAQTLKSFVKEQIETGIELPKELFNVYLSRKAIIK